MAQSIVRTPLRVADHDIRGRDLHGVLWLGVFCVFVLYGLRFIIFSSGLIGHIDTGFYYDITTAFVLGIVIILFTMGKARYWHISDMDFLFVVVGGVFLTLSTIQGSWLGMVISFQVFFLPILMRWVREVPRSVMKLALSITAVIISLFAIGDFLVLNHDWVGILSPDSGIGDFFIRFEHSLLSVGAGTVGADIVRPQGMLGYVLTSGVALGMLSAFFLFEALVNRSVVDYVITLLMLTALVLSTSTTGILGLVGAFVVLNLVTKPGEIALFRRIRASAFLIAGITILVIALLWPVLDGLWSRFNTGLDDDIYRTSFIPSFNNFDDVVRFVVGGNGFEYNIASSFRNYAGGWEYQGSTILIRESNVFNLISQFGVIPMAIVFWRWLIPVMRLRSRQWETDYLGFPFLAAFLAGIFTMVHDNGVFHWNNVFFFYMYYEFSRRYQTRVLASSRETSEVTRR